MEGINKIRFLAPPGARKPPTIEFDHAVGAWYVRFRHAKVAKTLSEQKPGYIAAVDLDSNNQVIGLELIGPREFSIKWLRRISPIDVSRVDFESARFVSAENLAAVR